MEEFYARKKSVSKMRETIEASVTLMNLIVEDIVVGVRHTLSVTIVTRTAAEARVSSLTATRSSMAAWTDRGVGHWRYGRARTPAARAPDARIPPPHCEGRSIIFNHLSLPLQGMNNPSWTLDLLLDSPRASDGAKSVAEILYDPFLYFFLRIKRILFFSVLVREPNRDNVMVADAEGVATKTATAFDETLRPP